MPSSPSSSASSCPQFRKCGKPPPDWTAPPGGIEGGYTFGSYATNFLAASAPGNDPWLSNPRAIVYRRFPAGLPDGTSHTLLTTEKLARATAGGLFARPYLAEQAGNLIFTNLVNASHVGYDGAVDVRATPVDYSTARFVVRPTDGYCRSATRPARGGWPTELSVCMTNASTGHVGGINAGMADGSVRFVREGVLDATWWAAMTPDGGEVPDSSW